MKKRAVALLLILYAVLAGALVLGLVALASQFRPHPLIECEAMRPLISFNGGEYVNPSQFELAHAPSGSELGPVVGMAGQGPHDVRYDCNLLRPGEQVYSIRGYRASFRLAVRTSTGLFFFDEGYNREARSGADLFDVGGKVQSITVSPIDQPDHPIRTIRNTANVQQLVNELLAAPIVASCPFLGGSEEALVLHLHDGSVVEISYWPAGPGLSTDWPQCVQLPPNFATLLAASH